MVYKWTHGIDKTHGIDMDSLMVLRTPIIMTLRIYSIGTPESHTYERSECCLYAGFLTTGLLNPRMVECKVFEGEHCKCGFVESKVAESKFVQSILHSRQASSIMV